MRRSTYRSLPILVLVGAAVPATIAFAQARGRGEAAALAQTKRQAAEASSRAADLEAQAAAAVREADRARGEQATVAARVKAAEADIATARARLAVIEQAQREQQVRLAARQRPIVRLAAALQGMARRPPALALIQPGSLTDAVHVRALLASSLPLVRTRTAGIRAEIAEGDRLRAGAAVALAALRAGEQQLRIQRTQLTRLEARHRARSLQLADSAFAEQYRAMALGEQARDIVDLLDDLSDRAEIRRRLIALPAPLPRPDLPGRDAAAPPAAPELPANYRLPAAGPLLTGLGEVFESGVRAAGLTIDAPARSAVFAPAAGQIAYAATFRGYGRIAIVDHGGGWLSLITGLVALNVAQGATVAVGDTIGFARGGPRGLTVELRHGGIPVDIAARLSRRG
jgi:septal ring factor EnvC (AmiA/AmiB activator)